MYCKAKGIDYGAKCIEDRTIDLNDRAKGIGGRTRDICYRVAQTLLVQYLRTFGHLMSLMFKSFCAV